MLKDTRSYVGFAAAAAILAAIALVSVVPRATAAQCDPPAQVRWFPDGTFECYIPGGQPGPGTPGEDDEDPADPPCDLSAAPPAEGQFGDHLLEGPYCNGIGFCVTTDLIVPLALPDGDPPNEDSEARYRWCSSGGTYQLESSWWTGENDPPSLLERALSAIGNIALPAPTLRSSPEARTLANLDTWFWAEGATATASGSAFDLVATATFSSMTVDPGDGSGPFSCPLVTSAAAARTDCAHTYRRASSSGSASVGGRPAFESSARLVYDLSFTVGGSPITVPGAPATLEAPVSTHAIRVDEVQALVTDLG